MKTIDRLRKEKRIEYKHGISWIDFRNKMIKSGVYEHEDFQGRQYYDDNNNAIFMCTWYKEDFSELVRAFYTIDSSGIVDGPGRVIMAIYENNID